MWGSGDIAPPFLSSAVDRSGQIDAPAALSPGKEPLILIGLEAGWTAEPVWVLVKKNLFSPAGNRTPAIQPVPHRYSDWTIPDPPER
jgi:hypothetical protein